MGHQRLGQMPTSKRWDQVVNLLGLGGADVAAVDVPAVAAATLHAAEAGFNEAQHDPGLVEPVYLLAKLTLAAREEDWRQRFADLGVPLADDDGPFEFAAGLRDAIQFRTDRELNGRHSDVAEIARKAACDAVQALAGPRAFTLFGSGPEELRDAIKELSTKKGFSKVGHAYFSGFLTRYLNFYLSRKTPDAVRAGKIVGAAGLDRFEDALGTHCRQTAEITRAYAGDWYSTTNWRSEITPETTRDFVARCGRKLQAEIRVQRGDR